MTTSSLWRAAAWAALSLSSIPSQAAVTAAEAQQLGGPTLTEFGAIRAGNADGSIPAYTGTPIKPPADYVPGSGMYTDPFKGEKPLLRIDAKNMATYAGKLSEGQKHLLAKNADYYIDLYPTHRTEVYPERVLKATVRNATQCKAYPPDYEVVDPSCRGGLPYPLPKNGYEVIWNMQLRYMGDRDIYAPNSRNWVVDAIGRPTMIAEQSTRYEKPFFQLDVKDRDPGMYLRTYSVTRMPPRKAGEVNGIIDFLDMSGKPRRAWNYAPGQRRVKLAPEFAYDTPVSSLGGVTLYDELWMFSGRMDRFDFKLVGKKEMIVPYNNYGYYFECKGDKRLMAHHFNPACERWELHRVWVVEATLKPGKRHAYSKRTYYIDEDGYGAGMFDAFDQSGVLYRAMFNQMAPFYDAGFAYAGASITYDFNKNMYGTVAEVTVGGFRVSAAPMPEREMSPEATVSRETVR